MAGVKRDSNYRVVGRDKRMELAIADIAVKALPETPTGEAERVQSVTL